MSVVDRSNRVIDLVVLCLPSEGLLRMAGAGGLAGNEKPQASQSNGRRSRRHASPAATAAQPAGETRPGTGQMTDWEADIRRAIGRLNVKGNQDSSLVLFSSSSQEDAAQHGVARAMASLLAPENDRALIYHSRNGIIAGLAQDTEEDRFIALRLLVEMMLVKETWERVRHTSVQQHFSPGNSAVAMLSSHALPDLIASEVIAKALSMALDAQPVDHEAGGTTGTADAASADLDRLKAATLSALEKMVPSGLRDATQARDANSGAPSSESAAAPVRASGATAPGQAEGFSASNFGISDPPRLQLKNHDDVLKSGLDATDPCVTFQKALAKWQASAIAGLQLASPDFKSIRDHIVKVDEALERFRGRSIPPGHAVEEEYRTLKELVRKAIAFHETELEKTQSLAAGLSREAAEGKAARGRAETDPASDAEFERLSRAYRAAARNGAMFSRWLWLTVPGSLLVILTLFAGALGALGGLSFSIFNLDPYSSDTIFKTKIALVYLACCVVIMGASGVAVWHSQSALSNITRKLMDASESLRTKANAAASAEFSARLHGLAANRLSLVMSKLERCTPDTGDNAAAMVFAVADNKVDFADEWQGLLNRAVVAAYHDNPQERNLERRAKSVLADSRCIDGLPDGQLNLDLKAYGNEVTLTQRLSGRPLWAELAPLELDR